jgi:hypothetical protein
MSYPRQCLGCQCEQFVVCVYVFCLINGHRLPCCPLCYLLPCRNYAGPSERHLCLVNPLPLTHSNLIKQVGHNAVYLCFIIILLVDLGGFAPPSRTPFSLLHTAITLIYPLLAVRVLRHTPSQECQISGDFVGHIAFANKFAVSFVTNA